MHLFRHFLALLLAASPVLAGAATIALTFDDGLDPQKIPEAATWNADLLASLRSLDIQAMVFPSLRHTGGEAGRRLVEQWAKEGHLVGNHTSRHRNLGSPAVSVSDFARDVKEAEQVFGGLPTWRYLLRFPYLKEGETAAKRDEMRAWMAENRYRPAPVSVDTSDWYFNEVFVTLSASQNEPRLESLRRLYVRHIVERATYYDELAVRVLGRSPSHVLLLHVNAINAKWLPDVIEGLRKRGWSIVPALRAFDDPMYSLRTNVVPAGESIVWSFAKQAGIADLRYPAEDSRYEEPQLRAAGLAP